MPRFFVESSAVRDGRVHFEGEEATHLARSLRVRPGERIVVVEDGRLMHEVAIAEVHPEAVTGAIERTRDASGDSRLAIHVVQALPARGMDDAIEALTIAGAAAIHPVLTERGVARPRASAGERRGVRWQAIARGAAQLAGRATTPAIMPLRSLPEALAALPGACPILACVAAPDVTPIGAVSTVDATAIACVIGSEGGLGAADLATLRVAGSTSVHLGERIIPSRLAGCIAVTLILESRGELDRAPADFDVASVPVPS